MSHPIIKALESSYRKLAEASEERPLLEREFYQPSQAFDQSALQDSFSWRAAHKARLLADLVIDDQGRLDKKELFAAITSLEKAAYSLGFERHHDAEVQEHLLSVLRQLHDHPDFVRALKRISKPTGHLACERLIRETLGLPEHSLVRDVDAKRAVLSALFSWLRQNVGSCFATAPAILIQQTQPLQFLKDMELLLATGRMSRVVNGEEFAVPLSISWGGGQLFAPIVNIEFEQLVDAPGLKAALGEERLTERLAFLKKKIETAFYVLTADEVIRAVLLKDFNVNEKDIKSYLEREGEGVMGWLVLENAPLSEKQLAVSRYLKRYESAKSIYKSMTDNALLRAWEYTIASLSESKSDFASWNLYASLGFSPDEPYGIGAALKEVVQEMIDGVNREIEECQSKYDHLFATAKYLEGRMKRASEKEIGWLTADYQIRRQEINRILSERDSAAEKGRRLAHFFNFFMKFTHERFKHYFQEVYDAQMHSETDSPFDDSPAGFRLLYKHGRQNTALWTLIHQEAEFLRALTAFFSAIEIEITQEEESKGLRNEIGRMVTAIIRQIKEPQFVEAASKRLQQAYRDPKRLPWSYISGGTMTTLITLYYGLQSAPKEQKRFVESATELLAFYIDTLKDLPLSEQRVYRERPKQALLAYSPTHAFLVKPALFIEAWDNDVYTYSWIRDQLLHPGQAFWDEQELGKREIEFLVDKLLLRMPHGYRPIVKRALEPLNGPYYPFELQEQLLKILSYEKWLGPKALEWLADECDALFYKHLPLFPEFQLQQRVQMIFEEMEELSHEQTVKLIELSRQLDLGRYHLFSSEDLLNVAKGLLLSLLQTTRSQIPFHQRIMRTMAKLGFCYPIPLMVGDTNWVKKRFAFVVAPGSRELELYCVDSCGGEGRPLSIWKPYLDGRKQRNWGLFISPVQYGRD